MTAPRKYAKVCDRCKEEVASRFRLVLNRFVCDPCYQLTLAQLDGTAPVESVEEETFECP